MNDEGWNISGAPQTAEASAFKPRQPSTANDIGWPQTANRTYYKVVSGKRVEIALASDSPLPDLFWELSVDGEHKGFFPSPLSARNEVRRIYNVWPISHAVFSFGAVLGVIAPAALMLL